ncbi:hypothetical protein ACYSNW_11825 [Enterococcus sp. LJL99]
MIGTFVLFSFLLVGCTKGSVTNSEDSSSKEKESSTKISSSEKKKDSTTYSSTSESTITSSFKQQSSNSDEESLPIEQSEESELSLEDYYYSFINDVRQKQIDYINSIEDPHVKQSVQSSLSAAISASNGLRLEHPEDAEIIDNALQRVLYYEQ